MTVTKLVQLLESRGITTNSIITMAIDNQAPYLNEIDYGEVADYLYEILEKREVGNIISTMLFLDVVSEKRLDLGDEWNELLLDIRLDNSLYGVDELMAFGISGLYGTIATTNYGYIDKQKPGLVGELDYTGKNTKTTTTTFADDVVGALVASLAAKIAHNS